MQQIQTKWIRQVTSNQLNSVFPPTLAVWFMVGTQNCIELYYWKQNVQLKAKNEFLAVLFSLCCIRSLFNFKSFHVPVQITKNTAILSITLPTALMLQSRSDAAFKRNILIFLFYECSKKACSIHCGLKSELQTYTFNHNWGSFICKQYFLFTKH